MATHATLRRRTATRAPCRSSCRPALLQRSVPAPVPETIATPPRSDSNRPPGRARRLREDRRDASDEVPRHLTSDYDALCPSLDTITDVETLDALLSDPSDEAIAALSTLPGDIVVLGVAGKMGPTLARMARRAADRAGSPRRVIGVRALLRAGARSGGCTLSASKRSAATCSMSRRWRGYPMRRSSSTWQGGSSDRAGRSL